MNKIKVKEKLIQLIVFTLIATAIHAGSSIQVNAQQFEENANIRLDFWLDPMDDTGWLNNDNITSENLSRIFIGVNLFEIAQMGTRILTPAEARNGDPGAAVEVLINGSRLAYATVIPGTGNSIFQYTFGLGDLSTTFLPSRGGGGLNAVAANVVIIDLTGAETRIGASAQLLLTLDLTAPLAANAPDLLSFSDSGAANDDDQTSKERPTFTGTGEPGTQVQLLANGAIVGRTIVDSLGNWEITSAPLVIGDYSISFRLEDTAGNISEESPPLEITIIENELVERIENLEGGVTALTELVDNHTHQYLTGNGKGHNNTVADTTPPTVSVE